MAETKMQLADWLDDLCVRFILNLPQEELASVERICFQVEEAQWFYEDFIRPLDPTLPSLSLRQFCLVIFQHCPMFSGFEQSQHLAAYSQFLLYKTRVPVRGVILLNDAMDHVVLVKGFKKGANWSFPRGKINKDEKDIDCAVREAYEETGYDLKAAGLVRDESMMKYIEVSMREQHMKLFVFRGVPMSTHFEARTRKEIGKIQWYKLSSLPGYQKKKNGKPIHHGEEVLNANKLYMVAPFLMPLKKWIGQHRREDARKGVKGSYDPYTSATDAQYTDGDTYGDDEAYAGMYGGYDTDSMQHPARGITIQQAHADIPSWGTLDSIPETTNDLRQLLSLSEPDYSLVDQRQPNNAPSSHAQGLLSMFQGNGYANDSNPRLGAPSRPLQTPMDQIDVAPPEPKSPRHHTTRLPPFSTMAPPPKFPFPQDGPQGYDMPPAGQEMSQQAPPSAFNRPGRNAAIQNHPQRAPYQRTGDPQFAQQFSNQHNRSTSIPAASQLPAPKLSNHALDLLNTFRSTDKMPKINTAVANDHSGAQERSQTSSRLSTPRGQQSPNLASQASTRRESRARFGGLIPSSVLSPTIREPKPPTPGEVTRPKSLTPRDAAKPAPNDHQAALLGLFRTSAAQPADQTVSAQETPVEKKPTHQDALLNLFNTPAATRSSATITDSATDNSRVAINAPAAADTTPTTTVFGPQKTSAQKAPIRKPVEASQTPVKVTPAKESRSSEEKPKRVKHDNAPPTAPKILQRPKQSSAKVSPQASPQPSAAKPSPAKTSDMPNGSTPSRPRRKKPVATSKVAAEVKPSPIKILKRPANENQGSPKETEVNGSVKKNFQPQILRRPQSPKLESRNAPTHEETSGEDSAVKKEAEKPEYPLWYAIHNPSMLEERPQPVENVRAASGERDREHKEPKGRGDSTSSEVKTPTLSSKNKDFLHSFLREVVGPKS
ncbi:MAG: mRNA-decapping enzyme subunit 2 [Alyxoria varia]|nr:MAG: mRNA-decapping enzyme subunit 2 [Alyxoria varia]